jgi:hypothetical protein
VAVGSSLFALLVWTQGLHGHYWFSAQRSRS